MSSLHHAHHVDAPARPGGQGRLARFVARVPFGFWMLTPLLVLIVVFVAYPVVYSLYLSFTNYRFTNPDASRLVGGAQYVKLFQEGAFVHSALLTAIYVSVSVSIEVVLGFALALALWRQERIRNLTRAILLTPMFVTPIAVGLAFRYILNQQLGPLPAALGHLGITYDFFGPGRALYSLAAIDAWQWTPLMLLLLLAGLESLPAAPFEAARIDGASRAMIFWRVTLPLMMPVVAVAVLIRMLDASKVFEYVYAITAGGPGTQTESAQYLMYETGIRYFDLGQAAAMAFVFVAILSIPIILLYRQSKKGQLA